MIFVKTNMNQTLEETDFFTEKRILRLLSCWQIHFIVFYFLQTDAIVVDQKPNSSIKLKEELVFLFVVHSY